MLEKILLNGWVFSFIVGWVVFLLLVDWGSFTRNVWGGIAASIFEVFQDANAIYVGMYYVQEPVIKLFGTPFFFTFGIAFTMGVLFFQYMPDNGRLQLAHIIMFTAGFVVFEYFLVQYGLLTLVHWNHTASFFLNTLIMGGFAWLKNFITYISKSG